MMKKILFAALLCLGITANAQQITEKDTQRARQLVSRMTLEEKCSYLSGLTSFSLRAIPRLGIPEIWLADGPQGVRNHTEHSTLFPSGILSAATWNRDLAERYGSSLGTDARARGISIMLGPGANMYRSPLCGRSYEYFGEDPYLCGETAKHYILGMQKQGVMATVKHFALNNQEWSRHHVSSDVDERTLFELYLPAFEKAVCEAGVGAVMDSYNLVNGVHATENRYLNIDILRNKWGFKGILMSDWTSVYSVIAAANNGLDLEMPKGKHLNYANLKTAIEQGTVDERTIDEKVVHLLQTFSAFGMLDRVQKDESIEWDNASSCATALDVAREGIVLLKNEGNLLPLKGTVAVLGPNADRIPTGGGSGFVSPYHTVTVAAALKQNNRKTIVLTDDRIYDDITKEMFTDASLTQQGFTGEYFKNKSFKGEAAMKRTDASIAFDWEYKAPADGFPTDTFSVRWNGYHKPLRDERIKIKIGGDDGYRIKVNGKTIAGDWGNHSYSEREVQMNLTKDTLYNFTVEYFDNISSANVNLQVKRLNERLLREGVKKADAVVYCTGFNSNSEGEGFDRPFAMPGYQEDFIKEVAALNPRTVVVLNAGGGVDMSRWIDSVKGLVMAWYPGQEGGTAITDILTGKVSPSGRLPISIEKDMKDNPCDGNYYQNTKEKECRTVEYREGLFTGYRGFDRNGKQPLFPFGFGLSYTTFQYSNIKATANADKTVSLSFDIKNTGKRAAADVAQIYVSDNESTVVRPKKELKGYEKIYLKPGEQRTVSITLPKRAFMYYDVIAHDWQLEPGKFTITVARSAADADVQLKQEITL